MIKAILVTTADLMKNQAKIGLFIVKHISNHLNHEVDVDSELGEGTTFKIHFPNED